jgi:glutathione S-transferase
VQQHYIPQQRQLHAQVAPTFAPHPSQSHHARVAHHPPPPHLIQHQQHPQHPPVQQQQQQSQQYNLPIHHHVLPIQQQSIAPTPVQHGDNQLQSDVKTQPEQQQYEHKPDAHLEGLKLVPDPPELDTWRQRLFDVDDMIVVSEEE